MAWNKTRYWRKASLDHVFGQVAYAFPSGIWMGLCTADPTDLGLFTNELSQTGYARVNVKTLMGVASLASGIITNASQITFGPAVVQWPQVTHAFFADSATIAAGNMIYFGPMVTSRTVDAGDDYPIRIGQVTIMEK